ncbi:MAG: hypothetical protein NTW76_01680 [Corynebacteriales bacterium]|nr:hypothetical protein [Mycobacteriales bacterium]
MDYAEAQAAFFTPREGEVRELGFTSPARTLRDALEPVATVCFWSEPAYDAYAAVGLDFLQGYVYSRACVLGDAEPPVAAAAFGVFEPGLISGVLADARGIVDLAGIRAARESGAITALREVLGADADAPEVAEVASILRRGVDAADPTGRALHAGLTALAWPSDPVGQVWHAATILREHRGDGHLAALVAAGVDGVAANHLTELWVGWDPLAYTASRAWSDEAMAGAGDRLTARGWLAEGRLTEAGEQARLALEEATDRSVESAVTAIGDDLDRVVTLLEPWGERLVARGWFPPDPYKRAAG